MKDCLGGVTLSGKWAKEFCVCPCELDTLVLAHMDRPIVWCLMPWAARGSCINWFLNFKYPARATHLKSRISRPNKL